MAKIIPIDMICEHSKTGTIMPIRLRVQDDDGEYQAYSIKKFREVPHTGAYETLDGRYINDHVVVYECVIETFGQKKQIRVYYDDNSSIWSLYM